MQYRVNIVSPKGEIVRSGLIMDFPKLEQDTKALDMANAMLLAMNGNQIQIVEPVKEQKNDKSWNTNSLGLPLAHR